LVLYLDAANSRSYPGTGTTWNDLSGNGNTGTLLNGPTYNSTNNGVIVFDGTDDVVNCGTTIPPAGNMSIFAWVYLTSVNSLWNLIVTKWFGGEDFHWALKSPTGNGAGLKQNLYTSTSSDVYGTTVFLTNTWYYVGFTLTNGGPLTFYQNGIVDNTVSPISRQTAGSPLQIGDARPATYGLIGRIPQVSIYNRAITASEVLQNYNALRGRYNL
jgi:hypothetical protein